MPVNRRISPNITPEIRKIGNWAKTRDLLGNIDQTIALGAKAGQASAAKKIKREARRIIRENGGSVGWPPVSSKYATYKSSKGYNPTNLYTMTGLYYRSIKTWYSSGAYHVGLPSRVRHTRKGGSPTLIQIAKILEHGSTIRNIAARPLWKPAYKQAGGSKRVKGIMIWHIRDQIFKRYGIRPKLTF